MKGKKSNTQNRLTTAERGKGAQEAGSAVVVVVMVVVAAAAAAAVIAVGG